MTYPIAYLAGLLAMAGIDFLWLTNTSAILYRCDLGPLLAAEPRINTAVVFYLIYTTEIVIFTIHPTMTTTN